MNTQKPFSWFAGVAQSALTSVTKVNLRDFFLDKEVCRMVNDKGRKMIVEMFDGRLRMPTPSAAAISYGHLASLGAHIRYPDNSEPNTEPMFSNMREAVEWLKRDVDFSQNDMFKRYYEVWQYLKQSFPDEKVRFSGCGHQGPLTSAVLLRGQDFYIDIYDEPELTKEFLTLLTDSIVKYIHLVRKINNEPSVIPAESYMADDFASLVSPWLWPEYVVPFWNQYYEGLTTGKRCIHVENLVPDHLQYLTEVGIGFFDPSVSAKLGPKIISERVDFDFTWRLLCIHIPGMTTEDVVRWVHQSVEDGARHLHTYITDTYCKPENQPKAFAFMDTCEVIEKQEQNIK